MNLTQVIWVEPGSVKFKQCKMFLWLCLSAVDLNLWQVFKHLLYKCRSDISSPGSSEPLTSHHLLTMESNVVLPPPGSFQHADLYSRKRWCPVQYLANEFWSKWRRDFLQSLQKWVRANRNLKMDDITIVKDETYPRISGSSPVWIKLSLMMML